MASRLCLSVFLPPMLLYLQKDLLHQASQGAVPVASWPFSELGYFEGSFRLSRRGLVPCLSSTCQLLDRTPRDSWQVGFGPLGVFTRKWDLDRVIFAQPPLATTPSSIGRVDCHRLRQSQCDRGSPTSSTGLCAGRTAPLLSCQCLGTNRTHERWEAVCNLTASSLKASSQCWPVYPRDLSCYGVPLRA